ncbi:hypothetical protein [Hahella ganghwensis]|uniref:hypothetical protein n=1 Tax=Hahella ganghwensis TaxID=286420 RepID=UPI00035C5881|nr:hypothetical protein [Hahella ganghwensis]
MKTFWVIDTKVAISDGSALSDDGSRYKYGRSVVPAVSKEEAVSLLMTYLEQKAIHIEEITAVAAYDEEDWSGDRHLTEKAYNMAKATNEIRNGAFISEKSRNYTNQNEQG